MKHIVIPPTKEIADLVKGFWEFKVDEQDNKRIQIRTFVNHSTGITFVSRNNNPVYKATMHGLITKPEVYQPTGMLHAFGVEFNPGAISRLFGINGSELTDSEID